jgi:hypothetical protein
MFELTLGRVGAHLDSTTMAAERSSLSLRRRSGERARERSVPTAWLLHVQAPLPNPLPARPSRGEGVTERVPVVLSRCARVRTRSPDRMNLPFLLCDPCVLCGLRTFQWSGCAARRFRHSDFVIPSDFVIRHSDFGMVVPLTSDQRWKIEDGRLELEDGNRGIRQIRGKEMERLSLHRFRVFRR